MVGGLAGVIGGVIYFVISLPINFSGNGCDAGPAGQKRRRSAFLGIVLVIIAGLLGAIILAVLTALADFLE